MQTPFIRHGSAKCFILSRAWLFFSLHFKKSKLNTSQPDPVKLRSMKKGGSERPSQRHWAMPQARAVGAPSQQRSTGLGTPKPTLPSPATVPSQIFLYLHREAASPNTEVQPFVINYSLLYSQSQSAHCHQFEWCKSCTKALTHSHKSQSTWHYGTENKSHKQQTRNLRQNFSPLWLTRGRKINLGVPTVKGQRTNIYFLRPFYRNEKGTRAQKLSIICT